MGSACVSVPGLALVRPQAPSLLPSSEVGADVDEEDLRPDRYRGDFDPLVCGPVAERAGRELGDRIGRTARWLPRVGAPFPCGPPPNHADPFPSNRIGRTARWFPWGNSFSARPSSEPHGPV